MCMGMSVSTQVQGHEHVHMHTCSNRVKCNWIHTHAFTYEYPNMRGVVDSDIPVELLKVLKCVGNSDMATMVYTTVNAQ